MFDHQRAPKPAPSPPDASAKEPSRHDASALEPELRAEAEHRLGFAFGRVRVDTSEAAGDDADRLGARAFTIGERIAFGRPHPAKGSRERRDLILHELAHVTQAYEARVPPATDAPIRPSAPTEPLERDALARLAAPPATAVRQAPNPPPAPAVALRQDAGRGRPDAGPAPPSPVPTPPVPAPPASAPTPQTPAAPATPGPAPTAGRPVSQTLYDGAVSLIQTRSAPLYNLLRVGRVGAVVPLPRASINLTPPPGTTPRPGSPTGIDLDFTLEIVQGGVAPGALAHFENIPESIGGSPTRPVFTRRLPIHVEAPPPAQVNPQLALSEQLYHEGIHALLAQDRLLAHFGLTQVSPFLAQRAAYSTAARAAPAWAGVKNGVEALIAARRPQGSRSTPAQAADEALEEILDERFALDRERLVYPGALLDNALIAREYLPQALVNQLVPGPVASLRTDPGVTVLIGLMTAVLNAIPFPTAAWGSVGRPPPPPPAAPSAPTPTP